MSIIDYLDSDEPDRWAREQPSTPVYAEPRTREEMHARRQAALARVEASARAFEASQRQRAANEVLRAAKATADALALEALRPIIDEPEPVTPRLPPETTIRGQPNPDRIIAEIAIAYCTSVEAILGRSRLPRFVQPRHAAIRRVRTERPDLSLPQIGRIFGRDHTTVLHALRKGGLAA